MQERGHGETQVRHMRVKRVTGEREDRNEHIRSEDTRQTLMETPKNLGVKEPHELQLVLKNVNSTTKK